MNDSNYRRYSDLTLDELEQVVNDLENMSIVALKQKKKQFRITILRSVQEAKKEIERRLKK
mgnify:FL=1|jgi:hypothetical protein|tara:strand:- start:249 stop:431 length:183 start_codon:yes stop_codon:yes gene_type:complete